MMKKLTVAVLGGGSFGTAIANIIAHNGHPTFLWMRDATVAQECEQKRENKRYLPGVMLAAELRVTADFAQAVTGSDLVFVSIPSHSFRAVVQRMAPLLQPEAVVISTAKG